MSTTPSQLLQTALSIIDGYNQWDVDAVMAPRAPNCTQHIYPARLNRPAFTNDQYRDYFKKLMPLFQSFHVTVLDTVEDPANNKVAVHARSRGETKVGPYANEYMLVFEMTDDHKQIVRFNEFVDSGYSDEFMGRLKAYTDQQQQQQ